MGPSFSQAGLAYVSARPKNKISTQSIKMVEFGINQVFKVSLAMNLILTITIGGTREELAGSMAPQNFKKKPLCFRKSYNFFTYGPPKF